MHSITCKAQVFITFMNSTTIQFTHRTDHHRQKPIVYHPTRIVVNTTDNSITAQLDLKSVHDHRFHGIYECTTSASLSNKPEIYSDSKTLTIDDNVVQKKQTGKLFNKCCHPLLNFYTFLVSVLAFAVQSSTDQSSSSTPTTETVYIVVGVTVFVVATAVLAFVVLHRLRSRRNNLLNEQQYI